jgi:glycosyltransferase involved in cell wall biosynthesis
VIEALACGLPVLATSRGGPADTITAEVGIHQVTDDASVLAEAMVRMRRLHARYAPQALRHRAVAHFSRPVVARQLVEVFEEAARPAAGTVDRGAWRRCA